MPMRQTLEKYLDWFKSGVKEIVAANDTSGYHSTIIGDGNPSLLFDNRIWRRDPANDPESLEPRFTNADAIFHLNPKAKIIAILRDPVTRLISEYNYFKEDREEIQSAANFHNLIVRNTKELRDCMNNHTPRYCLYSFSSDEYWHKTGRVNVGLYAAHLKEFYRVFPPEQVLVLSMEACGSDYTSCLGKTLNFLELEPIDSMAIGQKVETKTNKTRLNASKVSVPVWNSTIQLLKDFYKPYNEELTMLLGSEFNYN
ncbi:carbohydrate sulfotransferase 15-like [Mya arenaria]|uniref:carbohydrate sulfotransferase 15-like n=1 Tax=Mya arenaria TaxID=6604 RepID=UPI0022E7282A|nr:carbohydrate sulfotransferase 15-like [Mya arenaria]